MHEQHPVGLSCNEFESALKQIRSKLMSLTLSIICPSTLEPNQSKECTFNEMGGSVGRTSRNDFVLYDPDKFVSNNHALIRYGDGQYYIVDNASTNGVLVNDKMLKAHEQTELHDGDEITIGVYRLIVLVKTGGLSQNDLLHSTRAESIVALPPVMTQQFSTTSNASEVNFDDILGSVVDFEKIDVGADELVNPHGVESERLAPDISDFNLDIEVHPHENIPTSSVVNQPFDTPGIIPDDWDIQGDNVSLNKADNVLIQEKPPLTASGDSTSSSARQVIPIGDETAVSALLTAFFHGAQVEPEHLNIGDPTQFMHKLGELTRINVEGMVHALRARSTIKRNFRLEHTIVSRQENNPLKFSITPLDAMRVLLSEGHPGYQSACDAFNEAYKDLQAHQLAVMAGMQNAIRAMIEQLDPEVLEKHFAAQHRTSLMSVNKKSRNWELYKAFYQQFCESMMDEFQKKYGEEFSEAYEEQVNKLR